MESLIGKKLLILGGSAYMVESVKKAQSMGIYTIVTDWHEYEKSPAKQVADEYWMVSLADTEMLVKKIKENHVDGVFSNYTDLFLPYYVQVCEKAGLPCLANMQQIRSITNKDLSKQLCINHGISVSKQYQVSSVSDIENLNDIVFPVLTKPVDNSGQNGIYVCTKREDLKLLYERSLNFSVSHKVIVEEYVQGDYTVMFYTVQNGHVTLSTMSDKPVYGNFENHLPKMPMGYFLPSKYVELCKEKMLPRVQSFVTTLGIENGVIGIEGVVKNDDIFVFEMQFRLGGMHHHDFVRKENGMDILEMLLRFALTGKFEGWDTSRYDNPNFKHTYCSLNLLVKPDYVARIENVEIINSIPSIYSYTQMLFEGDKVKQPGTTDQIAFKFSMEGESRESLINDIRIIQENLRIYNDKGENIVLKLW